MAEAPVDGIAFYLDWKFWSVVVSAIAVVLSQLPPIHVLFRRRKLVAEPYAQIHLNHSVGNPNVQFHLILSNVGGTDLRVKQIALQFMRDGIAQFTLLARGYFQQASDSTAVILTPFRLKVGEDWSHIINFFNPFSRQDEQLRRQLELGLRQNINSKRQGLPNQDAVVEADEAQVAPLVAFFQSRFRWAAGEYEMLLQVQTDPPGAMADRRFRFTLFESDSNDLASYKDDYKFGAGILFSAQRHAGVIVTLTEIGV